MYLENDYFLNKYKKDLKDDKEVYAFLKRCFPSLSLNAVKGSYLSSELCFFSYLLYCYSTSELSSVLGNYFSEATVRSKLTILRSKKTGALNDLKFGHGDMGARKAYGVTKNGYCNYLSCLPDDVKPSGGRIKIRRSGGLVPGHDYGVGISLLSFMLLGTPFYYEKEENYAVKNIHKEKSSVCVDCTIYTLKEGYKIYIEQDMGNEPMLTLVNKIGAYKHLELTKPDSCIVFSSHAIMEYSNCASFSIGELEGIYKDMAEKGMNKVYSYFMEYGNDLSGSRLVTLKSLLVRTGVCNAYRDEDALTDEKPLLPEQVREDSLLRRSHRIIYEMKMEKDATLSEDFTLQELKRYIDDLSAGSNPYRVKAYNMEQYAVAKKKYRNMCSLLCHYINRGAYDRESVLCLLGGYSCYMVPSVLLSDSAKHFMPMTEDALQSYKKALLPYYCSIMDAEYKAQGPTIYFEEYAPVTVRNTLVLPNGTMIALEHVGKDIGGFLRCYYLCQLASSKPELKLHLVCLCDNDEDISFFCTLSRYIVDSARFSEYRNFYVSFLTEKELNEKDCLLKGITDLENPQPVYIKTKEQHAALIAHAKKMEEEKEAAVMQKAMERKPDLSQMSLAQMFQI